MHFGTSSHRANPCLTSSSWQSQAHIRICTSSHLIKCVPQLFDQWAQDNQAYPRTHIRISIKTCRHSLTGWSRPLRHISAYAHRHIGQCVSKLLKRQAKAYIHVRTSSLRSKTCRNCLTGMIKPRYQICIYAHHRIHAHVETPQPAGPSTYPHMHIGTSTKHGRSTSHQNSAFEAVWFSKKLV